MSKRIEAKITCPNCQNQFDYTLFRSIWGEYPANRELVMKDKINVAICNQCGIATKLNYPFIYTNAKQCFAVWWEPGFCRICLFFCFFLRKMESDKKLKC